MPDSGSAAAARRETLFLFSFCALVCSLASIPAARRLAAQDEPPRPVFVDDRTASRLLVSRHKPEYPVLARINFIEGSVRLELRVSSEGKVRGLHVLQGHPLLAAAAMQAARFWRFRPYRGEHGPVEFVTIMDVAFTLRRKSLNPLPPHPAQDLDRRVRPPQVVTRPEASTLPGLPERSQREAPPPSEAPGDSQTNQSPRASMIRLRVLVGEDGSPLDVQPIGDRTPEFEIARRYVERCTFQPARFGALTVPWYMELEVPAQEPATVPGDPPGN